MSDWRQNCPYRENCISGSFFSLLFQVGCSVVKIVAIRGHLFPLLSDVGTVKNLKGKSPFQKISFSVNMTLNLRYGLQILLCWFWELRSQTCQSEAPWGQTCMKLSMVSSAFQHPVYYFTWVMQYISKVQLIKLLWMFKRKKSVLFPLISNVHRVFPFFFIVCVGVCLSVKVWMLCSLACVCAQLIQAPVRSSVTWIFSFASGRRSLPRYCKSCSWSGAGWGV